MLTTEENTELGLLRNALARTIDEGMTELTEEQEISARFAAQMLAWQKPKHGVLDRSCSRFRRGRSDRRARGPRARTRTSSSQRYETAGAGKKPYRPAELLEKWMWLQVARTSEGGAMFSKTTTWPSALDAHRFR